MAQVRYGESGPNKLFNYGLKQPMCLRVLEITLRTPVALAAIAAMRKAVPEAIVGVGTLTRAVDFASADRCRH